jgi:uncharacterized protein YfiM (DUF2279 family)
VPGRSTAYYNLDGIDHGTRIESRPLRRSASHGRVSAHADLTCSTARSGFRVESDSWVGTDKLEHFAVSAPFGAFGGWLTRDTDHPVIYGTLIGTVPELGLQLLDGTCPTGGFSYNDLFAGALGALTGHGSRTGPSRIRVDRTAERSVCDTTTPSDARCLPRTRYSRARPCGSGS